MVSEQVQHKPGCTITEDGYKRLEILYVEELYCPCCGNKGADQLRSNCVCEFAYADCWFSHVAAQMLKPEASVAQWLSYTRHVNQGLQV